MAAMETLATAPPFPVAGSLSLILKYTDCVLNPDKYGVKSMFRTSSLITPGALFKTSCQFSPSPEI